ncbi:hypothetical protein BGZ46_003788 [Entomortierella lignicola]|nr:hypothetical protein BGZ46_003788 [Entomortierella lignicola]
MNTFPHTIKASGSGNALISPDGSLDLALAVIGNNYSQEEHQGHESIIQNLMDQAWVLPQSSNTTPEDMSMDFEVQSATSFPTQPQNGDIELTSATIPDPSRMPIRERISLAVKLNILVFNANNPEMSMAQIGKEFGLPRTTISSIVSIKDKILGEILRRLTINSEKPGYRVSNRRSTAVEITVAMWVMDLKDQGISVTDKNICAQAKEVHRILYATMTDKPPPCKYTTSWLNGCKTHLPEVFKRKPTPLSEGVWNGWKRQIREENLEQYKQEDIFFFDIVSLFLNATPLKDIGTEQPLLGASVFLSCNGTGSYKPVPDVTWGLPFGGLYLEYVSGANLSAQIKSMVESQFHELSAKVRCRSILLVDKTMGEYLRDIINSNQTNLRVIVVPNGISKTLPMALLKSEFKANYHEKTILKSPYISFDEMNASSFFNESWGDVGASVIKGSLEKFYKSSVLGDYRSFERSTRNSNKNAKTKLRKVVECNKDFKHYMEHNGYTGPSRTVCDLARLVANPGLQDTSPDLDENARSIWNYFHLMDTTDENV